LNARLEQVETDLSNSSPAPFENLNPEEMERLSRIRNIGIAVSSHVYAEEENSPLA
jgi:hypothetical protein